MASWIPFHEELRKRRELSRVARMIYLEISHEARAGRGTFRIRSDLPLLDAVHDALGGGRKERRELTEAWPQLTATSPADPDPLVKVDDSRGARRIVVESWGELFGGDTSAERMRKSREKRNPLRNGDVTGDEQVRNGDGPTGQEITGQDRTGEERRGDAGEPLPPPPVSERCAMIVETLRQHRDLFGSLAFAEVLPYAERIDREIVTMITAGPRDLWPDLPSEIAGWVTNARTKREGRSCSALASLGHVESFARIRIRERPGKAREERDRARAPAWNGRKAGPPPPGGHDFDFELERQRRLTEGGT
jgi:hypothetical protein